MSNIAYPERIDYKGIQPFKFWVQKVLPLIYDDSLSYYELLSKVVKVLNDIGSDMDAVETNMDSLYGSVGQVIDAVNALSNNAPFIVKGNLVNNDSDVEWTTSFSDILGAALLNRVIVAVLNDTIVAPCTYSYENEALSQSVTLTCFIDGVNGATLKIISNLSGDQSQTAVVKLGSAKYYQCVYDDHDGSIITPPVVGYSAIGSLISGDNTVVITANNQSNDICCYLNDIGMSSYTFIGVDYHNGLYLKLVVNGSGWTSEFVDPQSGVKTSLNALSGRVNQLDTDITNVEHQCWYFTGGDISSNAGDTGSFGIPIASMEARGGTPFIGSLLLGKNGYYAKVTNISATSTTVMVSYTALGYKAPWYNELDTRNAVIEMNFENAGSGILALQSTTTPSSSLYQMLQNTPRTLISFTDGDFEYYCDGFVSIDANNAARVDYCCKVLEHIEYTKSDSSVGVSDHYVDICGTIVVTSSSITTSEYEIKRPDIDIRVQITTSGGSDPVASVSYTTDQISEMVNLLYFGYGVSCIVSKAVPDPFSVKPAISLFRANHSRDYYMEGIIPRGVLSSAYFLTVSLSCTIDAQVAIAGAALSTTL